MNKYIVLNIFLLVNVSYVFGKGWQESAEEAAKSFICNVPYKKSTHALILSYPLSFVNGNGGAARYVKYVNFYSTKQQGKLDRDTFIDLVVFPAVDNVVGRVMAPVKKMAYVRGATQCVSPHSTNFFVDNVQLVTSAAITRAIGIGAGKGFNAVGQEDVKNFGKSCFIQLSCDAVDEAMIKPLVQMAVGDDSSLIGWAVHTGAKIAFLSYFNSMLSGTKAAQ